MSLKTLTVEIVGVTPLLMHSCAGVNKQHPLVIEMAPLIAKRTKRTKDDNEELARLEFMCALYLDADREPCIPGENIEGMMREAGTFFTKGKEMRRTIQSDGPWKLIYDGPKNPDKLWADQRFRDYSPVVIKGIRIMRCRPKFTNWALTFEISFYTNEVDEKTVYDVLAATPRKGLGDYRPRYGKFVIKGITGLTKGIPSEDAA